MFHLLLAALFLNIHVVFALEVNVPEGWSQLEVPSKMPPSIKSMIQVVSPSGDAQASFTEMEVVMSLDEAAEGYVRGMAKGGFQHETTSKVMHEGYESRHIKGVIPIPSSEDKIPVESYIILTQDSMVSAGVTGADASTTINDVLNWIQLPAAAVTPEIEGATKTSGRSFWEYVGSGVVFAAVGYALFAAISSRKTKKDKPL
ncbi:hypothetical protein OKA04_03295 [Luteolibacter flavescens]|uniref:Uncharacterized protein n=1 Tax=Luteolibacter flavescens TaxID=1859460 RepID=A0ABT3FJJ3_9BACT|nr:hypothetical protein [Luteolibacter flavescens]MCW1883738.1 hypothetical protein [Luteolibacter flavescens]